MRRILTRARRHAPAVAVAALRLHQKLANQPHLVARVLPAICDVTKNSATPSLKPFIQQTMFKVTHPNMPVYVFDFGGTLAVRFCYIPEEAFDLTLKHFGIKLPRATIRGPMGKRKWEHLLELFEPEEVKAQFKAIHGRLPTLADFKEMYLHFNKMQQKLLAEFGEMIPGAEQLLKTLKRDKKCKIIITTGWDDETTKILLKKINFDWQKNVDVIVTADQVKNGSRAEMVFAGLKKVNKHDRQNIYFITDSKNDIESVLKSLPFIQVVGVAANSTHVGIDNAAEIESMSAEELAGRVKNAYKILQEAGAHQVINYLGELPDVIAKREFHSLERRLGR